MLRLNNSSPQRSLPTIPDTNERTDTEEIALAQIYGEIQTSATAEENFSAVLAAIATHFETLIRSGNIHSPHVPELLQEVLMVLIMCKKNAEQLSISRYDIISAFDALQEKLPDDKSSALKRYKGAEFSVLLAAGIKHYNQRQPTIDKHIAFDFSPLTLEQIELNNVRQSFPEELHFRLYHFFSMRDQRSLSLTCSQQLQIDKQYWERQLTKEGKSLVTTALSAQKLFLEQLQYRLTMYLPTDQAGIDYLQGVLGVNCGPLTIHKIKNTEIKTIEEARKLTTDEEKRARILAAIKEIITQHMQENAHLYTNVNLEQWNYDPLFKYMIDGSLTKRDLKNFIFELKDLFTFLNDKGVQKYLDNGVLRIKEFSEPNMAGLIAALNNDTVQTCLDGGKLKLKRKTYEDEPDVVLLNDALSSPAVQYFLSNGQLTLDGLISVIARFGDDTYKFCAALENTNVQKYLGNGQLTIEQLCNLCGQMNAYSPYNFFADLIEILGSTHIQSYLGNGQLTIKNLVAVPNMTQFAKALEVPHIRKYLLCEALTIKQLTYMPIPKITELSLALSNQTVIESLRFNVITIEQLINLGDISEFVSALVELKKFTSFTDSEQKLCVTNLIKLKDISAFNAAIQHKHVNYWFKNTDNTSEFINLSNLGEFSRAIYDKNVCKLLDNNKLSIQQLIDLPVISVFVDALNHQQVRTKLKQGELTVEELINQPNITQFVNRLLNGPGLQNLSRQKQF